MIVAKVNPVGIDIEIDEIQISLYNELSWSSAINDYEVYHRAYKNNREDGVVPEVFTNNNDYQEVLMDDKFSATSFFLTPDTINWNDEGKLSADVSLIFQVNLKELYPSILHRADEEAHVEVINVLENSYNVDSIRGITTGISNVYEDLRKKFGKSTLLANEQSQYDDMEPFHVFKVDFNVLYSNKCNDCQ